MGILKRRSMLVTVRVSAEEHDALKASCLRCGARSISEFVRVAAMQRVQGISGQAVGLSGDLMTLTKGLYELDRTLEDIRKRIQSVLGPVPRGSPGGDTPGPFGNGRS